MLFLINKYEPDGPMSRLLIFCALAILHKLKPYGLPLF